MRTSDRRGFALPAAIGGLVIVGVLVTAGFYMARQEVRIGVASKHAAMALNIAQMGANEVMGNWSGYQLAQIPLWGDTTLTDTTVSGIWTVKVTNLNNKLYFLNATGEVTEGGALWSGANRRIGIVTSIRYAEIFPPATLTTRDSVVLKGGAEVHGEDYIPPEWAAYCDSAKMLDKPGIITTDTSGLGSTGGTSEVTGNPPYGQDSTLVDSTFTTFGELTWSQLVEIAKADGKDVSSLGQTINNTFPDSVGHKCATATLTNWGDPYHPGAACGGYFPLIYHGGPTLTIQSGGVGQGLLLVDGDLDIRGGFEFYGVVIVQGSVGVQGIGNKVVGAVLASNTSLDAQSLVGATVLDNSTCAIQRAIMNNAALSRARPLAQRNWIDLSAAAGN